MVTLPSISHQLSTPGDSSLLHQVWLQRDRTRTWPRPMAQQEQRWTPAMRRAAAEALSPSQDRVPWEQDSQMMHMSWSGLGSDSTHIPSHISQGKCSQKREARSPTLHVKASYPTWSPVQPHLTLKLALQNGPMTSRAAFQPKLTKGFT